MNKIIVIPAVAALAVIGLAACTAAPATQSESKPKPPAASDAPAGFSEADWAVIEEVGAEVGYSSTETAEAVEDMVYVWDTETGEDTCDFYYENGDAATQNEIIAVAFDGTTPMDWSTIWGITTYTLVQNEC